MKQTIQFRLGQHLTMTPQLQQAIRLLQLSALELQHEVQELLESNLMLETEEEGRLHDASLEEAELFSDNLPNQPKSDDGEPVDQEDQELADEGQPLDPERTDLAAEWPVDSDWSDSYDSYALNSGGQQAEYSGDAISQSAHNDTLRDYLAGQLNLVTFSDRDRVIAMAIIDAVSEDGYLTSPLEEIISGLRDPDLELAEVLAVLHRIQAFDPPGVAARDLQECLYIQLRQLPEGTPACAHALEVCKIHFSLFSKQRYEALKAAARMTDEDLQAMMRLLRTLNPYPGAKVVKTVVQYVVPDIVVNKSHGIWHVELNSEITPRLRVNPDYAKLVRRADLSADNACLKNHLQEARWFLKNLADRNETLLRVATKIVELQRGFFEHGLEAMRPMVLRDVADALSMHESTVSRVTSQKYLHSPRGTFDLKFFFPSHVNTDSGGQCSATAIRALIKKLIAAEQPESPLSDDMLARSLLSQGIQVARRTIAKYRESMGIQSSTARKRLL